VLSCRNRLLFLDLGLIWETQVKESDIGSDWILLSDWISWEYLHEIQVLTEKCSGDNTRLSVAESERLDAIKMFADQIKTVYNRHDPFRSQELVDPATEHWKCHAQAVKNQWIRIY
jgi:hypothetical protein